MRIKSENYSIPVLSLSFKESAWQYFSVIVFTAESFIRDKKCSLELDSGETLDIVLVRHQLNKNSYIYTATSSKTFEVLNSVTNPAQGMFSARTLLNQKLGFPCNMEYDSSTTWWMLSKTRLINVLEIMNKYCSVGNGGGSHFYVDLDGYINFINFKWVYEHSNVESLESAVVDSDVGGEDWVLQKQANTTIYSYGIEDKVSELNLEKLYGKASSRIIDSTGNFTDLLKQKLQNDFYNTYFTSRTIKSSMSFPNNPKLGTCFKINDTDDKFILLEYEFDYPLVEGATKTFNITLASCPR